MEISQQIKKITFYLFITCFFINCASNKSSDKLYSVKNGRIISPSGKEVSIKGCNIGNWFVLEMWMLDQKLPDQYTFESILEERFSQEVKNELMEIYRENWITEKDFKTIKSFGMNTIRIPFQYTILMDPEKPYSLKENAFYWLDKTIEWAENNDLSVILDLHGCPGRQSGMDHTGRSGYNRLWEEEEYQNQTIWLWKEISKYYITNNTIVAYDLLNEPWGGTEEQLRDIMFRMFKEIRAQGDDHIIIFPGHYSGIDFYVDGIEPDFENFIYTKHFYPGFFGWGAPVPQVHADFLNSGLKEIHQKMDSLNNTLLVGEFNVVSKKAGGGEMMRRYYDRYAEYGWLSTMWSYKVLSQQGGIKKMNWGMVTNKNKLPNLDIRNDNLNVIKDWFKGLSTMDIAVDEDLRYWLTTNEEPSSLDNLPPLPPPIKSVDFNDPLPKNWSYSDIGGSLKGGQKIEQDKWTIYGGGNDIWNESDQFRYMYTKFIGDFSCTVNVNDLQSNHSYAKAGIMARTNLNENSSHALINIFPYGNTEFSFRLSSGELMSHSPGNSIELPDAKLKLERKGNDFSGSIYLNEVWEKVGTITLSDAKKEMFIGLATLSHDNGQLAKAIYSNFQIKK
ncbi:MAG: hypothetical protein CMF96_03330 [Candidatus Marinimicrobia bacterium]|nr:hypothetical protein [Candidatus Neomarinimicrobiota bacterium]